MIRRKISGDDGDIFNDSDCVNQGPHEHFYQAQIQDTVGKEGIDEKLVAKVTGASQPLKKAHRGGRHSIEGDMNIFDLLQMFRQGGPSSHGSSDPLQQILMAAAHQRDEEDDIEFNFGNRIEEEDDPEEERELEA